MSTDISKDKLKSYVEDPRIACQYGVKCYQKNSTHKEKYKHPPNTSTERLCEKLNTNTGMKRKINDCDNDIEAIEYDESQSKYRKADEYSQVADAHSVSSSSSSDDSNFDASDHKNMDRKNCKDQLNDKAAPLSSDIDDKKNNKSRRTNDTSSCLLSNDDNENVSLDSLSHLSNTSMNAEKMISEIFLFKMPNDFYKFYDFCVSLSNKNPTSALQTVNLKLVGPFDILNGNITQIPKDNDNKDKYLLHWRYFYDPPEFQTILKGDDKEGLHYGYWRDECHCEPVFVAKNLANRNGKIIPVASNLFGAVKFHIDEQIKLASPFEKIKVAQLLKKLTAFAKEHGINIEKNSKEMHDRDRKVVTKTFHGAGIVVPYDNKTQVGYRVLAATDSHLKTVLQKIETAEFEEVKMKYMREVEEVVRMAAIAADECDFGTPLELAHDLFTSGIESLQKTALHMFTMAYSVLNRPQFLKIAAAHMKNRKKELNLSVI